LSIDGETRARLSKVILAEVPLKGMLGYSTVLRSLTKGTGTFTMEFLEYGKLSETDVNNMIKEFKGK
jgi:elongation factor G